MAIFNINDDDYLGCVNKHDLTEGTAKKNRTIKEKLLLHIKKHVDIIHHFKNLMYILLSHE